MIFLTKNFFLVFQSNVGFIPGEDPLFGPLTALLMLFFVLGLASYVAATHPVRRYMGIFLGFSMTVWFALVLGGKLTLSPTRHSLILLPLMAITVSEGVGFLARGIERLGFTGALRGVIPIGMAGLLGILFFTNFERVLAERRDPFVEPEILALTEKYHAAAVIGPPQIKMMKSIQTYLKQRKILTGGVFIISIDQRKPASEDIIRDFIGYLQGQGLVLPERRVPVQIVYQKEIHSDVEIEFLSKTKNWPNCFYLYVIKFPAFSQKQVPAATAA